MSYEMNYEWTLQHILDRGVMSDNRTAKRTLAVFGHQMRYNMSKGFPLITSKKVHFKSVIRELVWFLSGSTSAKDLQDMGCTIWDEWATAEKCAKFGREEGDLGPVYGKLFRNFGGEGGKNGVDQISWVVNEIINNPNSRRLIVSAWHPLLQQRVELPPCHTMFQFCVRGASLSLHVYMRSCDAFLGLPFNLASYALLNEIVADACRLYTGDIVFSFGDLHLYEDHINLAYEQISRPEISLPTIRIHNPEAGVKGVLGFKEDMVELRDYNPHPAIKAEVAV